MQRARDAVAQAAQQRRRDLHSRRRRCRAACGAGAAAMPASAASASSCSAPACGTIRASSAMPRCRAAGMRRPIPRASATSRRAIARKYGQDPVRTATLAYDATALVAALVKTQGAQRFSEEVLTNPSGFAGIDGMFRFKPDGTNERGLAVMRVGAVGRAGRQPGAASRSAARREPDRVTPRDRRPPRRAPGKPPA